MKVGIPKEIKQHEGRVSLTPKGAKVLSEGFIEVLVEEDAGKKSGFSNEDYETFGAKVGSREEAWDSDLVVKVKEPLKEEYKFLKENKKLFTYWHAASNLELTLAALYSKCTGIAYETVYNNGFPLLKPMSEIAGKLAVHKGVQYLIKSKNKLPENVLIIGGGTVGFNAASTVGEDVKVVIMESDEKRFSSLKMLFASKGNVDVEKIEENPELIRESIKRLAKEKDIDLVVGAIYIPGAKAPHIITKDMLKLFKKGTVLADVSIDQGGCFETSRPTTHKKPTYIVDGIVHYCVANMPGAVPYTSTVALTEATLPYVLQLAVHSDFYKYVTATNKEAGDIYSGLKSGINFYKGFITNKAVAASHNLVERYKQLDELLK